LISRWSSTALLVLFGCAARPETRPEPARPTAPGGDLLALDESPQAPAPAVPAAPAPAPPPPVTATAPPPPTLAATLAERGSASRGGAPLGLVASANEAIQRGRYEAAIQTAKQALRRDEKYVPAMVVLAKGYYYLRKYELCEAILDIAEGIDKKQADIPHLRGFVALARDNKPAAIASFRKATELDPNHAEAWNSLGAEYVEAKNYREAVPALEKAVALSPRSARAQLNLGSAYRGAGEYAKAEASYRRALELRRAYPEALFDLGILYLDAPEFPGLDPVAKLQAAIDQFTKYKEMQSYRLAKDDPVDGYLEEARKGIERERKRMERDRKRAPAEGAKPAKEKK
jgi:tetratricopeptide (TPR) repeat protein